MNVVTINPTKFVSVRDGTITWGVRVYDHAGMAYENNWEEKDLINDFDILETVLLSDNEEFYSTMQYVWDSKKGLYIGNRWYEWAEIDGVFTKHFWNVDSLVEKSE